MRIRDGKRESELVEKVCFVSPRYLENEFYIEWENIEMDLFDQGIDLPTPKKLFIRPVSSGTKLLVSIALARTNGCILVDEDIICHFPPDESGRVIRQEALDHWGAEEVEWGEPIHNP